MATIVNIAIDQGTDFLTTIQVADETGNVKDLSNCTARAQLRKTFSSHANTEFTIAIDNPDEGEIKISLDHATTANLKQGRYVYDLHLLTENNLSIERITEGIATVYPGVTR